MYIVKMRVVLTRLDVTHDDEKLACQVAPHKNNRLIARFSGKITHPGFNFEECVRMYIAVSSSLAILRRVCFFTMITTICLSVKFVQIPPSSMGVTRIKVNLIFNSDALNKISIYTQLEITA